jgi:high-affinity nickel-transport protein
MWTLSMGYLFGLLQGVRHAFEPDHVAAVSTVVAEQRSARVGVSYAACWGIGHALVLLLAGGALFLLRREMPVQLAHAFELCVAMMLVALGVRAMRHAAADREHGPAADRSGPHVVGTGSVPGASFRQALRPLAIGVVHGLAGTGALTALVASSYPSAVGGLSFLLVYGLGATGGMALFARALGGPLACAMRMRFGPRLLLGATGAVSLVLGVLWGLPIVHAMVPR